ncbi:AAA family ATPase [Synergistaceae bacterium OttesenSCG-928-D05]|nr:AAA family ATPase [Synergistaceae bacterium OttesenSCG-928-D05]
MHEKIEVFFFDGGDVFIDDLPVRFPYLKAKLLLLLLLETQKPVSRKKLCDTIWSEEPETAGQNLRNALSSLRKILPPDFISASRENVRIDGNFKIYRDLDELDAKKITEENIERLSKPFLGKLRISGEAGLWAEDRARHYKRKLHAALTQKIDETDADGKNFWHIWLQSVEEKPAQKRSASGGMPFVRIEERESILTFLCDASDANKRGAPRCAIVFGEEGSGKSVLSSEILKRMEEDGAFCLRGHPQEGGQNYRETLGAILEKILLNAPLAEMKLPDLYSSYLANSFPEMPLPPGRTLTHRAAAETANGDSVQPKMDFNPHLLGRIFAYLLNHCFDAQPRPIFLLLEDIQRSAQWMPDFLRGLFENTNAPLATMLTSYPELKASLEVAFAPLQNRLKHNETYLSRLTPKQTEQICRRVLPPQLLTPEKLTEICAYTDGSPFLLGEFLRFYDAEDWSDKLSKSLYEVVHRRILSLSEEELDLLHCVAIFPDEAPFELLKELLELSDAKFLKLYEGLHRKGLLYDSASENSYSVQFRYALIKKQIKESISKIKWWNLHKRLLKHCEISPTPLLNEKYLPQVAFHAGDYIAELRARVFELKKHFEFNHELFPKLSDTELFETPRTLNDTQLTANYLQEAQDRLDHLVREHGKSKELIQYEQILLTIQGGYLRWNGDYPGAENCLKEAMKIALQRMDGEEAIVDVLEQLCYLGIQQDNHDMLRRYAFQFYRAAQKAHMSPQVGMALRFIAILNIMQGAYEAAEKQLNMSLRLFEKLETLGQGYTLSVIAATHYHGDIALCRGDRENALKHYLQCAKLCEGKRFYRGLGVHLAKAAWCEFRLGQIEEARAHLEYTRPLFEGFRSRRGAGLCGGEIVFGLTSLLNTWGGKDDKAYENLKSADELVSIIQKPLWEGMLYCVKALQKERNSPVLAPLLTETTEFYLEQSKNFLGRIGMPAEAEAFEQYSRRI